MTWLWITLYAIGYVVSVPFLARFFHEPDDLIIGTPTASIVVALVRARVGL